MENGIERKSRDPVFLGGKKSFGAGLWQNLKYFLNDTSPKISKNAPQNPFRKEHLAFGGTRWENFQAALSTRSVKISDNEKYGIVRKQSAFGGTFLENARYLGAYVRRFLKHPTLPKKSRKEWKQEVSGLLLNPKTTVYASYAIAFFLILGPVWWSVVKPHVIPPTANVTDISSIYLSQLPPGKDKAGGGGGGGERAKTPPTKGKLPRWSMTQIAPPMVKTKPDSEIEATLLGPPELKFPSPNLANFGDPLEKLVNGSGGPGGGSGIGTGTGTGIGSGTGGGLGPGSGGGTGGGAFRPGTGGVGYPACAYCPDPRYSEEARKAKYQGTVVLQAVITADGRAVEIRIIKGPGLGLEERAVEAVRQWRFTPAIGPNGKPVAVIVPIEVTFRLL